MIHHSLFISVGGENNVQYAFYYLFPMHSVSIINNMWYSITIIFNILKYLSIAWIY